MAGSIPLSSDYFIQGNELLYFAAMFDVANRHMIRDFLRANYPLPLPKALEITEVDGAITISLRIGQYETARELRQLIPWVLKWRDRAVKWNGGYWKERRWYGVHPKDLQREHLEYWNKMHTGGGGNRSYGGVADYLNLLLYTNLFIRELDNETRLILDALNFSESEIETLLADARHNLEHGLPPFPDDYPPVTRDRVISVLRTWRKQGAAG